MISAKGAEPFLEGNCIMQLKFSMNDRSQDVRAEFYKILFHWMTKMEIHHLRMYESEFVQMLLNGIAESHSDVSPRCIKFLDDHGKRMKEALIALGEEKEEVEDEEEVSPVQKLKETNQIEAKAKETKKEDAEMT